MYVLSLDEGTTSARALLVDVGGEFIATAQQEISQSYPSPGWVEEDPEEIWQAQYLVLKQVCNASTAVVAIGIANQRETTIVWDRHSGEAIYPAIVWQDRRTAAACEMLLASGSEALIRERTGLVVDPYFSATKIAWILDNVAGARERAERGELAFGTVDSWLVWKLTQGAHHVTDVSNASRTLLCNLQTAEWDDTLLQLFRIPRLMLPRIVDSSQNLNICATIPECVGVPITGIAGDQQAALFGQGCFVSGQSKCTYGTGCFLLQNVGSTPVLSARGILTTIAWRFGGQITYALEGSVFIGGAVVQWLRDGLKAISCAADSEALAASVPDSGGVYLVPAFTGLGAPHWDPHARGTICGITRGTTMAHLTRASLESIAFQVADLVAAMSSVAPISVTALRADGGAAANKLLMQFQADILNAPVECPLESEATAMGAAYLAGLAVGFWRDTAEISNLLATKASQLLNAR